MMGIIVTEKIKLLQALQGNFEKREEYLKSVTNPLSTRFRKLNINYFGLCPTKLPLS